MPTVPNTLGYNVEQWGIEKIRAVGVIPGNFSIEHKPEDERAEPDRIYLDATEGEQDLGGSRPHAVALTVQLVSVSLDNATREAYEKAIDDAFDDPSAVASTALFIDLFRESAEDEQKEESGNTRKRSRTWNLTALLAEAISTYFRPDGASLFFRPDGSSEYARP